ncbi:DUF3888 domain-containing protein [Terrilactibacillus laevilacticus]|uniref:DUF3888 domain-containing protein n=1 Tax=Terrilactibacillus laevilacticus TaxID=1380157 RepID=A0ABW5PKS7_9BACI|nr:DUF3888 domain-containing protein [Terrilactibacillus laevilacticus]
MVKRTIFSFFICCVLLLSITSISDAQTDFKSANTLEGFTTSLLYPAIENAVKDQYGKKNMSISDVSLIRTNNLDPDRNMTFVCTVSLHTSLPGHRPPFAVDTIKFKVNKGAIRVLEYKHKMVPASL